MGNRAIFHAEFHYTSRQVNAGWSVKPSPKPQTFPRELIEAAVKAGVAVATGAAKNRIAATNRALSPHDQK